MAGKVSARPGETKAARKPQCHNTIISDKGNKRQCPNDGNACYVEGSFGRQPKVLCPDCERKIRLTGWTVTRVAVANSDLPLLRKEPS